MRQILQNIKTGQTELADVPAPTCPPGHVLIATRASLVSAGTERMLVEFGKAGWIGKARRQPDKVKQILTKIRTDGLIATARSVINKLDEPLPLGYCNSGTVLQVGEGVTDLVPNIRVACNGYHAEVVCVPRHLCARIPDSVSFEEGAFTPLGSIALQGVRLARPEFGEMFLVFGLGLVGLLTVQFLKASGCRVLGADYNSSRLALAKTFGAEVVDLSLGKDPAAAALARSNGKGVDGVIITASAMGDEIVHQSAVSCRRRGRIILVGVVDLNLRRSDFYEKEITFQVSCSYGPGRYDEKYEQGGQDYPYGFVRWTELRNFEAVLESIKTGQLNVKDLISHRVKLEDAAKDYENLLSSPEVLGIILEYPYQVETEPVLEIPGVGLRSSGKCVSALIGSGNFGSAVLAPALAKTPARLKYVSARTNGAAAARIASKYGFEFASTDLRAILADPEVNTVFIAARHNSHPDLVCSALEAGKHVFVEKPLAIDPGGLDRVIDAVQKHAGLQIMVGFNRRFSPHIRKIKGVLAGRVEPLCMSMAVNAGMIPDDHWIQDPAKGGGRIIGEGCHFIDLLSFLADSPIDSVSAIMAGTTRPARDDRMSISLGFADGSIGTINYFSNGSKSYPKESLEIFSDSRVIRMDNFRTTKGYGFAGFSSFRTWKQDKGHEAEIAAFVKLVSEGGAPLIPFEQIVNVTRASFAAIEAAKTGTVIRLK